jgi:hypothetical protein
MKILSIDPGPIESGLVVWNGKVILCKEIINNEKFSGEDIQLIGADVLLIEQIKSYGMSVSDSVFDTVFWTGRFVQKWKDLCHRDWYRVPRREIKMHLCGSMRAKDSNIRQAIIDRFGVPGTKKNPGLTYGLKKDLWSAFALAIFWSDTH